MVTSLYVSVSIFLSMLYCNNWQGWDLFAVYMLGCTNVDKKDFQKKIWLELVIERYSHMFPCLLCIPPLKCFSPTAGHTVVETLCLRKDSGTDLTSRWKCCAVTHWFTKLSSVLRFYFPAYTFTLLGLCSCFKKMLLMFLFGTCVVVLCFCDEACHFVVVQSCHCVVL